VPKHHDGWRTHPLGLAGSTIRRRGRCNSCSAAGAIYLRSLIQAICSSAVHTSFFLHYPSHPCYRTSRPKHLQQHVEHGLTAEPSRAKLPTAFPSGTTLASNPLRDHRPLHQSLRHCKNPTSSRGLTDTSHDYQGRSRGQGKCTFSTIIFVA